MAGRKVTAVRAVGSEIAVDGDQTPYSLQTSKSALDQKQYSEELQLSGKLWNERLRFMVGLYAFHESGDSTVDTQSFHGLFENPLPGMMAMDADAADTLQIQPDRRGDDLRELRAGLQEWRLRPLERALDWLPQMIKRLSNVGDLEELLARTSSFTLNGEVELAQWPEHGPKRLPLRFTVA